MSGKALEWVMDQEIPGTEKLVLAAIASFHSVKQPFPFASRSTLAKRAGIGCVRTIERGVQKLEARGLISVMRSTGRNSNTYKLHFQRRHRVAINSDTESLFNEPNSDFESSQQRLSVTPTATQSRPNKVFNKGLNKKGEQPPDCPHQEIIEIYHETLPSLRRVRVWSDKRKRYLQARWKEECERQSLDWWKRFFEYVGKSDFLTGKVNGSAGRPRFLADLEWIVTESNFAKIIEGKYDNER